jgi:hypothetical protein
MPGLVEKVQAFWQARGHDNVRVWQETVTEKVGAGTKTYVKTKSNLVNGLPPRGEPAEGAEK